MNGVNGIQAARIVSVALATAVVADTLIALAQDAAGSAIVDTFSPEVALSLGVRLRSSDNLSFAAVAQAPRAPAGEPSVSELNRQLTNPVSSIWSISNQFNN